MEQCKQDEIQRLLYELTEWQRISGMPPGGSSDFKSTGESNAAMEDLKRKLDQLGARYHWSERAGEYQLDVQPNSSANERRPQ